MIEGFIRLAERGEFPHRLFEDNEYRLVVLDELTRANPTWRAVVGQRGCRWPRRDHTVCGDPAVVELDRRKRMHDGRNLPNWYAYCPKHLFGRAWVDGKLESAVLVRKEDL